MITAGQLMVVSITDDEDNVLFESVTKQYSVPDVIDAVLPMTPFDFEIEEGEDTAPLCPITITISFIPPASGHAIDINSRITVMELLCPMAHIQVGEDQDYLNLTGPLSISILKGGEIFGRQLIESIERDCRTTILDMTNTEWLSHE
jgi:hypothetical protein